MLYIDSLTLLINNTINILKKKNKIIYNLEVHLFTRNDHLFYLKVNISILLKILS